MRSTGQVRRPDSLGRVVIPFELRRLLGLDPGTPVELLMMGEDIVLKKWKPKCVFCGVETEGQWSGKYVCELCLHAIVSQR